MKGFNLFSGKGDDSQTSPTAESKPSSLLEDIAAEPQKITEVIKFKMIKLKGKRQGLVISPKKAEHKGKFEELGFLSGDIVVAADGKPVLELMKDPKSWQTLLKSRDLA